MTIQESKPIVGTLVTQGQAFDMLSLNPLKRSNVPFWMAGDVFEFLIVNGQGYAQTIIVGRSGFYILPALELKQKIVSYMDGDENSQEVDRQNTIVRPLTLSD